MLPVVLVGLGIIALVAAASTASASERGGADEEDQPRREPEPQAAPRRVVGAIPGAVAGQRILEIVTTWALVDRTRPFSATVKAGRPAAIVRLVRFERDGKWGVLPKILPSFPNWQFYHDKYITPYTAVLPPDSAGTAKEQAIATAKIIAKGMAPLGTGKNEVWIERFTVPAAQGVQDVMKT